MDDATLSAYDRDAKAFANDWDAQPPPSDLHAVVRQFFIPGPTADVGCGSGRDAAWRNACGYPTTGFDASEGLLAEARRRHPQIHFSTAILPGLNGIAESSFEFAFSLLIRMRHEILCRCILDFLCAGMKICYVPISGNGNGLNRRNPKEFCI